MSGDQPVPKLQPTIISKETGISLAVVLSIGLVAYHHGVDKGKAEARDRDMVEIKQELKDVRSDLRKLDANVETICANTPRCKSKR